MSGAHVVGNFCPSPRRSFDVVRAQRFELVDAKERPWATLGFDQHGEVQFNMLNQDGRGEIMLSFTEEEPEIVLFAEGNVRASLQFTRGETAFLLYDGTGTQCVKLHVDDKEEPHMLTYKSQDEWIDVCTERGA